MGLQIGHLSLVEAPATADVIPSSPPPEVLDEVAAAARRAEALAGANRELHFVEDASSGRLIVEVRDLDGSVVRAISPSQALDVMSGSIEP